MHKILFAALVPFALGAQYAAEPAGPPPAELPASFAELLQKEGTRISNAGKPVAEFWFRSALPAGPKTAEDNVTLTTVPHGSFLGVLRVPERYADRRGQTIKAGVYTLRLSFFPQNGDHQGVAPQRDFLLLIPISEDKDPNATPNFETVVEMSRKASGTPHPAVLSIWKADPSAKPGLEQQGEHDWVLQTRIGDTAVALIVIGKAEG